jgi:alpha-tubulin suppressor-like RCC1 family protein
MSSTEKKPQFSDKCVTGGQLNAYNAVKAAISSIHTVAAGSYHTASIKSDGTVWTWGSNSKGQLGNGEIGGVKFNPVQVSDISDIVSREASSHTVALKSNGTVWAWGDNQYGKIGDGTTVSKRTPVYSAENRTRARRF